ncbi:MAG: hypothetical protein A3C61_03340 [Candidatus Yanofskybacteria bacterium RIFCSPHIGHO2_02_FULL_39_10]|uniref:Glycosyl transferase family 1 domain-containing protein n=1 Tax=Candidatus Yanofskybacteria bacterium RIFCSPHIGHO2_02_FULL_39_10 TaxID=1802674 RepID=A0A1F8F5R3_9BACT|nr:MAG: hypothetical protein A3C61_03340 [Candidatus Yanofskybacteria bacterium RIFCSPHIGHO2_02_FULL_39_10]
MSKKILISGYTYVDESTIKTFDYYPEKESIHFLVPKTWPLKGGKYIYHAPVKENVKTTKAFFTHSNYPVIGGIFKGLMPVFPIELFRQKPDIVFSASEPNILTTLYQGFFSKLFGAKHVIFTWETIPYENKFKGLRGMVQRFVVRLNLLFCDSLICGSVRGQQMINSLTDKPTAVIPLNGIDMNFFTRDYSKKSFRGVNYADSVVFSFAGAIGYRKGVHLIIKAFEEISKKISNVKLIIAGSGEYDEQIAALINKSGLGPKIIRVPWLGRDELLQLFNSSDIFLYPSIPYIGWEEQFGFSLAEASSMELPIITTQSGSISEVVLDGKTGILIQSDDYAALREAMIILANDEQERISMGRAGRQFINDTYSNQVIASKFYNFFNTLK